MTVLRLLFGLPSKYAAARRRMSKKMPVPEYPPTEARPKKYRSGPKDFRTPTEERPKPDRRNTEERAVKYRRKTGAIPAQSRTCLEDVSDGKRRSVE